MPTIQPPNHDPIDLDAGCYVDGHRGQYGLRDAVELADSYLGTSLLDSWPVGSDGPMGTYAEGSPWSGIAGTDEQVDAVGLMVSLGDEAENALNAATDGGRWEWSDGEFFLIDTGNPFRADGPTEVPDDGGYNVFAVTDDGGTLCYHCLIDPRNPVHDERDDSETATGDRDGWGVTAFDADGNNDGWIYCDHCAAIIVEGPECAEPGCTAPIDSYDDGAMCEEHAPTPTGPPPGSTLAEELRQAGGLLDAITPESDR